MSRAIYQISKFQIYLRHLSFSNRCFYIQVNLLIAAIIVSEQDCLMYISSVGFANDMCMTLCLVPMLTVAVLECRIFAYFLLIRERLMVINETILYVKNDLNSSSERNGERGQKSVNETNIFFIASELGSFKINGKFTSNGDFNEKSRKVVTTTSKSNFISKVKSIMQREKQLLKQILFSSDDDRRMYVRDLEATKHQRIIHANYHMRLISTVQIIYTKLHEISNLISTAFGIQIITIISVQFITLTTLMYTFSMSMTRWLFLMHPLSLLSILLINSKYYKYFPKFLIVFNCSLCKHLLALLCYFDEQNFCFFCFLKIFVIRIFERSLTEEEMDDVWTSLCWIFLIIYKLYSICYSVHSTLIEVNKQFIQWIWIELNRKSVFLFLLKITPSTINGLL